MKCPHLLSTTYSVTCHCLSLLCQLSISAHTSLHRNYLLRLVFLMALFQFFDSKTCNNQLKFCCETTTFICVLQSNYLTHLMYDHCNKWLYLPFQTQYCYCDKVDKVSAYCNKWISANCSTSLPM
jgi:hypothetical protein